MLPPRSTIQLTKTSNPGDEKIFSTYQAELNHNYKNNGSLVNHYGNSAYLLSDANRGNQNRAKSFLAPSYHNLNSNTYMCSKESDNYSNNYRSSFENPLHRSLTSSAAPIQTQFRDLFEIKTAPIAQLDPYETSTQALIHVKSSDYLTSNQYLKTKTQELRDKLASLMELADYMRNKSYNVNEKARFNSPSGVNYLESFGKLFTQLIESMETTIGEYDKLRSTALEIKKMTENFRFAEDVIQRNIWDRDLRPAEERNDYRDVENSIHKDRRVMEQEKRRAIDCLNQADKLLK